MALNYTADWDKSVASDNLFFQPSFAARVPHKPVGKTGPMNCQLRLWSSSNTMRDTIYLSFQKQELGAASTGTGNDIIPADWVAASGGVAKGLPGGAGETGDYDPANPVYTDEDHKWIIGRTAIWGDGQVSHYFAYIYFQFATNEVFKTEDLGRYRAKVVGNMGAGDVIKYSQKFSINE